MVAEDQGVVGVLVEDELTDAGFLVAGPFIHCSSALDWLKGNHVDAAVLNVVLADGPCDDLARALNARDVPFVIYSGRSPETQIYVYAEWIEKPAPVGTIAQAVSLLVGRDRETL